MPYQIEWRARGTLVVFTGKITQQEVLAANAEHYGDPRFDDLDYELFDFTEADLSHLSTRQAEYVAHIDKVADPCKPRLKAALVASDDFTAELCSGYIEKMKAMGSPWLFSIFPNRNEALKWCQD